MSGGGQIKVPRDASVVSLPPDAGAPVCDPDQPAAPSTAPAASSTSAFAAQGGPSAKPLPAMSSAQRALFGDALAAPGSAPAGGLPDSEAIFREILERMREIPPPRSTIQYLQQGPPPAAFAGTPLIAGSVVGSISTVGVRDEGRDYAGAYLRGLAGLRELWSLLEKPPEEIARMGPGEMARFRTAVASYRDAADALYAEGISYGWTPTRVLSRIEFIAYEADRAAKERKMPLRQVKIAAATFGFDVTNLNKLDSSGHLGDIVRDRQRELLSKHLGEALPDSGLARGRTIAPPNGGALSGTTTTFVDEVGEDGRLGFTEGRARRAAQEVHAELQAYLSSAEFRKRLRSVLGDHAERVLGRIKGLKVKTHVDYKTETILAEEMKKGALETRAIAFMGRMKYGESTAGDESKRMNTESHFRSVQDAGAKGAADATHALYGVFKSVPPRDAGDAETPLAQPVTPERPLEVTADELKQGRVLRPEHSFGFGLRQSHDVKALADAVEEARARCEDARANRPLEYGQALAQLAQARDLLRNYLLEPRSIDPHGMPVLERFTNDYARSLNVYRFRTEDGDGFVALKRAHVGEVIRGHLKAGGRQWVAYGEGWKLHDFMRAYSLSFGSTDAAMAYLFDSIRRGFAEKGFDIELCQLGGDELLIHAQAKAGTSRTDAEFRAACAAVEARVEHGFSKLPYKTTEKTALRGGRWGGATFGVTEAGKLLFKQPAGVSDAEFARRVGRLATDEGFLDTVHRNFEQVELAATPERRELDFQQGIRSEEAFNRANGGIARREAYVFREASGEPRDDELYLDRGAPNRSEAQGAVRQETTFRLPLAAARLEDPRDLPVLVNEVLPEAVAKAKVEGSDVPFLARLTGAQKARGRLEWRTMIAGAHFAFASIGSKFITNVFKALASGDLSSLRDGIDLYETASTFAAMTLGHFGSEMAYRFTVEGVSGNLRRTSASGVRSWNAEALQQEYSGWRARGMGAVTTVAALSAVELAHHGKVDPQRLAESLAIMKSAQWITKAALTLRRAKTPHPVKLLIEFLVMEGLSAAVAAAAVDMERGRRRERLANAMSAYDEVIESMVRAPLRAGEPPLAKHPDAGRLAEAYARVARAFRECDEFEKFTGAREFTKANKAYKAMEEHRRGLEELKKEMGPIADREAFLRRRTAFYRSTRSSWDERANDERLRHVQKGRFLPPAERALVDFEEVQLADAEMVTKTEAYRRSIAEADTAYWRKSADRADFLLRDPRPALTGRALHVPFEAERAAFLREREEHYQALRRGGSGMEIREARYAKPAELFIPADQARHDWSGRHRLPEDWRDAQLKFSQWTRERRDFLLLRGINPKSLPDVTVGQ